VPVRPTCVRVQFWHVSLGIKLTRPGWLIGVGLLLLSCGLTPPPQLVRDRAHLFSDDARAAAESRLDALAVKYGVWAFVITDLEGDSPRMLDEPMREADTAGVRAVAILFGRDHVVGGGFSRIAAQREDSQTLNPPDVGDYSAPGRADAALGTIVDYLETWVSVPTLPVDVPPVIEVGPSGP
jgi:hypothetical protein